MRRTLALIALALALLAVIVPSALATRAEERQGAGLLRDFEAGKQSCATLGPAQFELIGEYEMSQMVGSPVAHDAMNARIKQMMGPRAEAEAHIFLAKRNLGCAQGDPPASFMQMMGVAGAPRFGGGGGMNPGGMNPGGMGSGGYGTARASTADGNGWSAGMIVGVVLLGVGLFGGLAIGAAMLTRRRSAPMTARQILDRRLADGEIDSDEYARRRLALDPPGGPGPAST